jgi:hypothetical protein
MSSPMSRIVTMYRLAWKNVLTDYIDYDEFSMSLDEMEAFLSYMNKIQSKIFIYWIESEDFELTFETPS